MTTVFLADDEYYVRTSLKNNIPWTENDFSVIGEANNGKDALAKIVDSCPDICIIDINMPGLNGIELITALRQYPSLTCEYIILTGYNEFKYAQNAIRLGIHDYILKPIDYTLFLNSLKELKEKIGEKDLLSSRLQDLESENKQYRLDHYYNDLVNCNLSANSLRTFDKDFENDLVLSYESFRVILCDISAAKTVDISTLRKDIDERLKTFAHISCIDTKKRLFFIVDSKEGVIFQKFLQHLSILLKEYQIAFVLGIGSPYPSFDEIYLSFNEASIALKDANLGSKKVVQYQDIKDSTVTHPLHSKTKNALKAYIVNADMDNIASTLQDFYETLLHQNSTFNFIILQTLELLNLLIETLSSTSPLPISVLRLDENIFDQLNQLSTIENIEEWILSVYQKSITKIILSTTPVSDITKQIEQYVADHYTEPELSIPQISEELYLNYSYICYCFKRDKGITINDYINQYRIQKALEYFHNHADNVCLVAEKTGFNNASYFSKRFKKQVGLSPSEYMKTIH